MNQPLQDTLAPRAAAVRTLDDLRGPAGRLEALFAPGRPDAPYATVVAHPHPLFGGTMHTKVVYHAAKTFQHAGLPVLRFNYRGVGTSEGKYDRGEGERQDLAAAIEWLKRETGLPILAAGFSFGAWVTLRLCCAGEGDMAAHQAAASVRGIVAIGLPIRAGDRTYTYDFLPGCELPKLFVSGGADEFGAAPAVEAAFALATPPAQLLFVPGADHFFQGVPDGLKQMQAAIRAWLEANFGLHAFEERLK